MTPIYSRPKKSNTEVTAAKVGFVAVELLPNRNIHQHLVHCTTGLIESITRKKAAVRWRAPWCPLERTCLTCFTIGRRTAGETRAT